MKVTARVTLQVEVDLQAPWDENETLARVHKQAVESALGRLGSAFTDNRDIRVVGTPRVVAVMAERQS